VSESAQFVQTDVPLLFHSRGQPGLEESSGSSAAGMVAFPPASRAERLRKRQQAERLALASAGAEPKRAKVEQPSADPAEAFGGEEEQEEEVEVQSGHGSGPTEAEEGTASTFLAAVKARLTQWGKVAEYHKFVLALSGCVDVKAALKILRGHDDLIAVFQRKFAPDADLSAVKAEIKEEDEPRPPPFPPARAKVELQAEPVVDSTGLLTRHALDEMYLRLHVTMPGMSAAQKREWVTLGAIREFSQDWKTKKDTGKGRPWGPMEIGKGKGEKGKKGEWRKGGWKGDKTPAAKVEPTRPSQ
ncbi:unnamed protein product, partial [Symbiodinium microadriaticum]